MVSEEKRSEEESFSFSMNLYFLRVSMVKKVHRSAEVPEVSQR
jgi:hypothetical protein